MRRNNTRGKRKYSSRRLSRHSRKGRGNYLSQRSNKNYKKSKSRTRTQSIRTVKKIRQREKIKTLKTVKELDQEIKKFLDGFIDVDYIDPTLYELKPLIRDLEDALKISSIVSKRHVLNRAIDKLEEMLEQQQQFYNNPEIVAITDSLVY